MKNFADILDIDQLPESVEWVARDPLLALRYVSTEAMFVQYGQQVNLDRSELHEEAQKFVEFWQLFALGVAYVEAQMGAEIQASINITPAIYKPSRLDEPYTHAQVYDPDSNQILVTSPLIHAMIRHWGQGPVIAYTDSPNMPDRLLTAEQRVVIQGMDMALQALAHEQGSFMYQAFLAAGGISPSINEFLERAIDDFCFGQKDIGRPGLGGIHSLFGRNGRQ